jgi:hypothetical protein
MGTYECRSGSLELTKCILDTSSLKHLARIEMGGKSLLDLLRETLEIILPAEVRSEVIRRFARDKEIWQFANDSLLKLGSHVRTTDPDCVRFFEAWLRQHGEVLSISRRIEPGERHCAALGLQEVIVAPVSLNIAVTDDKSARVALNAFFNRQNIGHAVSTPDVILFLLNRIGRLTKDQAIRALNEYYLQFQDHPRRPLKPSYLADIQTCWREM